MMNFQKIGCKVIANSKHSGNRKKIWQTIFILKKVCAFSSRHLLSVWLSVHPIFVYSTLSFLSSSSGTGESFLFSKRCRHFLLFPFLPACLLASLPSFLFPLVLCCFSPLPTSCQEQMSPCWNRREKFGPFHPIEPSVLDDEGERKRRHSGLSSFRHPS